MWLNVVILALRTRSCFMGGDARQAAELKKLKKTKTNKQNSFVGRLLYMQENAQRE